MGRAKRIRKKRDDKVSPVEINYVYVGTKSSSSYDHTDPTAYVRKADRPTTTGLFKPQYNPKYFRPIR